MTPLTHSIPERIEYGRLFFQNFNFLDCPEGQSSV